MGGGLGGRSSEGDHLFKNDKMEFSFPINEGHDGKFHAKTVGTLNGDYVFKGQKHYDSKEKKWTADFEIVVGTYTKARTH